MTILEALPDLNWQQNTYRPKNEPGKEVPFHSAVYDMVQADDLLCRSVGIIVYPSTVRLVGSEVYSTGFDLLDIDHVIYDSRELYRGTHADFLSNMENILEEAHRYFHPDTQPVDLDDIPW